ncbi:hypothetical protein CEUSTIGMA_g188.t1 [Chlamydomonas eustigma]|uniref:Alpha-type protein kinase domain-containing protein n=1 Tax=Chlamydomonas eustigma TaxID=1157962 RepID=A0A250WPZ8_9CHLO|nr:hypothetical protein CEUSTIGMA_g188.t1 [Chlamydomonas eustigma]|eukprot:GAX72732.1 hypothetical protein CEUSTIGMA_g188.t1 [Chlamydomonas eustigma]
MTGWTCHLGPDVGTHDYKTEPKTHYQQQPGDPKGALEDLTNGVARIHLAEQGKAATNEMSPSVATSAVSMISHVHGRQRRDERSITRRELQEAIKYGQKLRANPGRNGDERWRYTHKGVVYITDSTSRHEITSWRVQEDSHSPLASSISTQGGVPVRGAHVVLVVDGSGSMRRQDVPGFEGSRLAAVYQCVAKDLVDMHISQGGHKGTVMSIIQFHDEARILLERAPVNSDLSVMLQQLSHRATAYSHGNFLPALETAYKVFSKDTQGHSHLFLWFLSDGAPSDQYGRVTERLLEYLQRMGSTLGKDRFFLGTVAFGPSNEDYSVLKHMASTLPRSSFQKLGLSIHCLRSAFSSLATSITTLQTELGSNLPTGTSKTIRSLSAATGLNKSAAQSSTTGQTASETGTRLGEVLFVHSEGWDIYCGPEVVRRQRYSLIERKLVQEVVQPVMLNADTMKYITMDWIKFRGLALYKKTFEEGSEQEVWQCSEVVSNTDKASTALCHGPRLVAKESKLIRTKKVLEHYERFCRTAAQAEELALLFNNRLKGGPEVQVHFLQSTLYQVKDSRYPSGLATFCTEQELDGKFTKWNNNAGAVLNLFQVGKISGVIDEEVEEGEGEEDGHHDLMSTSEIPQCFSHFTYEASGGVKLVCDIQGVWNPTDGFTLTDPVIHHCASNSRARMNGATDKGVDGFESFFSTHICNGWCRRLGLSSF